MIIGYDASRISVAQRTGTEHYSYLILRQMLAQDSINQYRIYSRAELNDSAIQGSRVEQKVIGWPRLWTQGGLAMEVLMHQPDVLFVPAHTMPVIHRPGLKTVVTIHDLGYEYLPQYHQWPQKLYLNRSTEFAAAHASHLIAVSEFTKQDLIRKLRVPAERISVVYEGVDLVANQRPADAQIESVRQKFKLAKPYVLFVGTIQPRKNLVRLIEAFARLDDPNLDLVLAGGKGWLSDDIYAAPAQFGIADQVKFLGYISDQERVALYAGAQLSTLVSLFEGFGLPVLESMAVGTPVLAANSSSLPEVVGDAGLLVDPTSVKDIAEGLRALLSNTSLQARYRQAGLEQVRKFSWDIAAAQTLEVLTKTAQG